jgi:hypothetical protein
MWMVAGLQVHRLEAGEMLAVQRPNVDDTDRRATQPPAHFHRVFRSFALRTQTAGHDEFVIV